MPYVYYFSPDSLIFYSPNSPLPWNILSCSHQHTAFFLRGSVPDLTIPLRPDFIQDGSIA